MLLPLDALCQSQSHLPSRVQSPGPFKPYNSAFCLVIMQLIPAPIIQLYSALLERLRLQFFQLCLSVWLVFLTPSGSQVNAWSLSRTAYKCKTLRSNELTSSANSTSKQYHNALLPCWCFNNTFQCGSMPGIAWLAATFTIDHFLECVCPLLFAHAVAFGCLVPVSESFTFPSPVTRPFQAL